MLDQLASPRSEFSRNGLLDGSSGIWEATVALGRALTTAQVGRFIVEAGLVVSGASGGALATLTHDRHALQMHRVTGTLALDATLPILRAVQSRRELWIATPEEFETLFPGTPSRPDASALAVLPLAVDSVPLGGVLWSYPSRGFTPALRYTLRALVRAGGDALFRVGLFESERRARAEAVSAAAMRDATLADAARRDDLLAQVSELLEGADDPLTVLPRIAQIALPLLGEWCSMEVLGEDGRLHRVADAHLNKSAAERPRRRPASRALPRELRDGHVVRTSEGERVMVVPMRARGRTVGVISFASADRHDEYGDVDTTLVRSLGSRCGSAIEFARHFAMAHEARQAREDFVAATSHELRTPLSHIKGFVSTLRSTEREWEPETRDDFLAEIERESDRLAKLVDDLLDMSRIDAGELDPQAKTAIAPAQLVAAGIDRLGSQRAEHQLEVHVSDELPPVWADSSQVERVIANLLDNASKYSPPKAPIAVIGRLKDKMISIRVEDHGLGIPPDDMERIFEPFFREPRGGYPSKPGSGLGLAICRSIVRAQHGRIWAEPRAGGGSAFEFTLPLAGRRRRQS